MEGLYVMDNDESYWVGNSSELKRLEKITEKYACVDFPVLIRGERGSGKILAARSIHSRSHRRHNKFIQSCCLQWDEAESENLAQKLYHEAQDGTLFLRNINALPEKALCKLQHYWEREYIDQQIPVRIICSISQNHDDRSISNSIAPWLTVQLPTLHERANDVKPLVDMLLEKYSVISKIKLDHDSWRLIENHHWKDNVKGLEKAIALLSVMTDADEITVDILYDLLPVLKSTEVTLADKLKRDIVTPEDNINTPIPEDNDIDKLICDLSDKNMPALPCQHPALIKSLNYLSKNYSCRLSLEKVANISYVSPSHLSYLYRKHLDISFKQLLLNLRIHRSKLFLKDSSIKPVTWISNEVGFHDLSHFEKTFKRIVGMSPLFYRNH